MILAEIDQPAPSSEVHDEFLLRGWVFSESGLITHGKVAFEGSEFALRLGLARPDVLAAHPATCRNVFVGFEGTVKVPAPVAGENPELLLLLDFEDSTGLRHGIKTTVMRSAQSGAELPAPFLHGFDLPVANTPVHHTLAVEGWVLSDRQPITRAELIAGDTTTELSVGWPRPDVVEYFKIHASHVRCGFRGLIMPRQVGTTPFQVRFYSGELHVATVDSEVVVATADSVCDGDSGLPQHHLEGLAAHYVDILTHTLNGSIYSDEVDRSDGRDWPVHAHTMLGLKRLDHLRCCVETVLHDGIQGDFIETGVWKGGSCVLMRGILRAAGDIHRKVWVADSFQGLPMPDAETHPLDEGDSLHIHQDLVIPLEQVKGTFRKYGLLDSQVEFLPGWFCDTLPTAPIEKLAVLRLDGDMYESTIDALNALYHKLQPGGFCIIDDYGCIPACRMAVHDFRREHGINEPIQVIDWTGVFWRKQNPS